MNKKGKFEQYYLPAQALGPPLPLRDLGGVPTVQQNPEQGEAA